MRIFLTGGTGSFGTEFIRKNLENPEIDRITVFSRDEVKQSKAKDQFNDHPKLRFFIGDVRNLERLRRAIAGTKPDLIIHAAALKQVPSCEYNPMETVLTNIQGTQNIIDAAIESSVPRFILLSSDKAVNPVNLYGATKLVAEKLVIQSNNLSSESRFSVVRYGNIMGSRGSVLEIWLRQAKIFNRITVTDERMTRFWFTILQAVDFVKECSRVMYGGEIFVPKLASFKLIDMARVVAPDAEIEIMGMRPAEKLHEILLSREESRHSLECKDCYVILPEFQEWEGEIRYQGSQVPEGFSLRSDYNTEWFDSEEISQLIKREDC